MRFGITDKANLRPLQIVTRDKEGAQAVTDKLHRIGVRGIALAEVIDGRPEMLQVLLEVGNVAQMPRGNVVTYRRVGSTRIKRHEPVGQIRLRVVVVPVSVTLDTVRNPRGILHHVVARALTLHHDRDGKQGAAVFVTIKKTDVLGKATVRRKSLLLLSKITPAKTIAATVTTCTRGAQLDFKGRQDIAQSLRLDRSDRLIIAAVLHQLQHARSFHVSQHVHIHRVLFRHVDHGFQRDDRRRQSTGQLVPEISIRLDTQVGRNKIDTVKAVVAFRIQDAGLVGTLGIGQMLCAIQFNQLHRGPITEGSLFGNTDNVRPHHAGFRRIDCGRIDSIATKVPPWGSISSGTL